MNAAAKSFQPARLARLLFGALVVLYVFSRFIPCTPASDYPMVDRLENSWTQALHLAFVHQLQSGTEIIFTYGPWGFLARGYHPQTYSVAVIAWIILSVIFLCAGWRVAKFFSANVFLAGLWLVGFAALASLPAGEDFNTRHKIDCQKRISPRASPRIKKSRTKLSTRSRRRNKSADDSRAPEIPTDHR